MGDGSRTGQDAENQLQRRTKNEPKHETTERRTDGAKRRPGTLGGRGIQIKRRSGSTRIPTKKKSCSRKSSNSLRKEAMPGWREDR